MLQGHPAQDLFNAKAAAFGVVRRQRPLGEITAPELPGDKVHVALDAGELRLGLGQDLLGRHVRLQIKLQFFGELFLAQPPFAVGARQQIFFQKLLVLL